MKTETMDRRQQDFRERLSKGVGKPAGGATLEVDATRLRFAVATLFLLLRSKAGLPHGFHIRLPNVLTDLQRRLLTGAAAFAGSCGSIRERDNDRQRRSDALRAT